jgi:hypothetical protein
VLISLWLFLFPVFLFAAQPKQFFFDGLNLVSNIKGGIQTEGVLEQGAEQNIWTEER